MTKLNKFAQLAVFMLLSISCHHAEDPAPTKQTTQTCFPHIVTQTTHSSSGTSTLTTTYEYDVNFNLTGLQDFHGHLSYKYGDGKIIGTMGISEETWSYNNAGLLSHITGTSATSIYYKYTQDFDYDNNGLLTSIRWRQTTGSPDSVLERFHYEDGSLKSYTMLHNNVLLDSTYYATFDTKKNPWNSVAIAMGNQACSAYATSSPAIPFPKNNAISYYAGKGGNETSVLQYNEQGYPVKITTTQGGVVTIEISISYYCQ